jgi:hypothetical protein
MSDDLHVVPSTKMNIWQPNGAWIRRHERRHQNRGVNVQDVEVWFQPERLVMFSFPPVGRLTLFLSCQHRNLRPTLRDQ